MRIHLERSQVPAHILGSYRGHHITAEVTEEVTVPMDAGLWSGGTRELYRAINLANGHAIDAVHHNASPFGDGRRERRFKLEPNIAMVRSGTFCGKDAGLHFYIHPSNAPALLPKPGEALPEHLARVLKVTCELKSAYRADELRRHGIGLQTANEARQELIRMGLLDARGAITVKGRNVVAGMRGY